jgi:hypothetical protein
MGQKLSSAHFGSISNTIIPGPLYTHTHTQLVVGLKRKKKTWLRNKIEKETKQVVSISSITESNVVDLVGV